MIVQLDTIGTGSRHDLDGDHYNRLGLVTDVTATNKLQAVREASGVPKVGDPHPSNPASKVQSVAITPAGNDTNTYNLTITYSSSTGSGSGENLSLTDPIEIRYDNRTITETTIYDRHGDKMTTHYVESISVSFSASRVTLRSAHRVEIERPGTVISITRTTRTAPDVLNKIYGGKVNSGRWGQYSRYQVLCEGFEGTGQKGSNLWRVTGRFYPSPLQDGTWKTQVFGRNSDNIIPTDARLGRGLEQYEAYHLAALRNSGFTP